MELPIWATVFISGIIGSWLGRAVSNALFLPLLVIGGLGQAAVTGAVLLGLLPALSQVRVSFGTAFIAVLVGNLVTVVGVLVLLRAAVQSSLAGGGGVGILPAFGLFSLGLTALGIFVTATMISSSQSGSGSGLDLYGGQAYLDEIRKDHNP